MRLISATGPLSLVVVLMLATADARAHTQEGDRLSGIRWELWGAATSWPALSDLEPEAGGSFDSTGFGLGMSAHWPVGEFEDTTLLIGLEGAYISTSSDVPVFYDDLYADDIYLALSSKWLVGEKRRFVLDAGLAYHMVEITQREDYSYYYDYREFQSWEETAVGGFVGVTWDTWADRHGKDGGLALALKIHYVDLGRVQDEDVLVEPVLGTDAGTLDGPLVVLQFGYSSR